MSNSLKSLFVVYLKLGLTSFGGPIAHLGYFHNEFVERRKWLSDSDFAQLLALCQFLPGPASSQLGFGIGLVRAGWRGALLAFVGFTLPSSLLLIGFAALVPQLGGELGEAGLRGLKLVALAVVGHGLVRMARQLCPDVTRAAIAVLAVAVLLLATSAWFQIVAIVVGGAIGFFACRDVSRPRGGSLDPGYRPWVGYLLLVIFALLLLGLPLLARSGAPWLAFGEAFYRAGALVFGGGHVVLPLLEETVVAPGWISQDEFLAGYGAAQAVPGPMFSLAAYLGALLPGSTGGMSGALLATAAIFLPGFLLFSGILPMWQLLSQRPAAAGIVAGVNAAVVGLLAAALYDPVFTSAVRGWADLAIGVAGFLILLRFKVSSLWIVAGCLVARIAASIAGLG